MNLKYVIDALPPSNNKFKGRQNHWEYRNLKKEWEQLIRLVCKPVPKQPLEKVNVTITYFFPDKRRRDPDNFNGVFLLDGLVKAGILKDDNFDCITLHLRGGYDKQNPRTEIEIVKGETENEDNA